MLRSGDDKSTRNGLHKREPYFPRAWRHVACDRQENCIGNVAHVVACVLSSIYVPLYSKLNDERCCSEIGRLSLMPCLYYGKLYHTVAAASLFFSRSVSNKGEKKKLCYFLKVFISDSELTQLSIIFLC